MLEIDKDILYRLYVVEQKPMHEIAKELNVAIGSIYNYLKRYKIETRDQKQTFTFKGRKHTEELRIHTSKIHKGKKVSDETKKKIANAKFKGGIGFKKRRTDGYIYIYFPEHPKSTSDGYIMEHILVMECILGRHLRKDEVVHHKNHKKDDNRKDNLELMTFKEHAGLHMRERHALRKGGMTYQ